MAQDQGALGELQRQAQARGLDAPQVAAFLAGAAWFLDEPPTHKGRSYHYIDAAGRLLPLVQADAFSAGHEAAGGGALWRVPLGQGLWLGASIQLDRGRCALTQAQMAGWGVAEDRVTSALRSMLFHKSWDVVPRVEGAWELYQAGDGLDAERALILEDLDYGRFRAGLWVALPHAGALMVLEAARLEQRAAFAQAARARYEAAAQGSDPAHVPLSPRVYALERWDRLREVA
jgi:hypothetical protein